MPNSTAPPRVFQALNGAELKDIILKKIAQEFDANPRFRPHLTFPLVSFGFRVHITAYPMEPPSIDVAGTGKVGDQEGVDLDHPVESEMMGSVHIDAPRDGGLTPDEAREQADLPVTRPEIVSHGGRNYVADVPDRPVEIPPPPTPEPFNRKEASPNVGRSVDIRTRASGSGPGVARVDESIIDKP